MEPTPGRLAEPARVPADFTRLPGVRTSERAIAVEMEAGRLAFCRSNCYERAVELRCVTMVANWLLPRSLRSG